MVDTPKPGSGETYEPETPQTKTPKKDNNVILTQEQFDTLIKRLDSGNSVDRAAAPSMTPGIGLQVNPFGQVVGTMTKFNIDPTYYPDPIADLLDDFDIDPRMRRHNVRENYLITFDMTAKPYQTKDFIIRKTLHMNEDEELARNFAAEQGVEVSDESLRDLLDKTRYARIREFIIDAFYPPRNFDLSIDSHEEAIGGSVVKVVTKSNVKGFGNKTPVIKDEELV